MNASDAWNGAWDGSNDDGVGHTRVTAPLATQGDLRRWQLQHSAPADSQRRILWEQLVEDWLDMKETKSASAHTRRNYAAALNRWRRFLAAQFSDAEQPGRELWDVDHTHVRHWQSELRAQRLSESTINHQLSCVSSFYSFVINEKRMVAGIELDLFVDRLGRKRDNPFKVGNLRRGKVTHYERARPLTVGEYCALLDHLEGHSQTTAGARNYALILTFLHTGWRSSELLRMRWQDLRPSRSQPGTYIYAWRGKGAKSNNDLLPADCWHAIRAYLLSARRWRPAAPGREEGLSADEYVWLPVAEPNMTGLRNANELIPGQPLSEKSALRVLRTALRQAEIPEWQQFRIHDLRHTHARLLMETGETMAAIQQRLHHSSLATTGLYLRAVHREDPVDTFTQKFRQLRMAT